MKDNWKSQGGVLKHKGNQRSMCKTGVEEGREVKRRGMQEIRKHNVAKACSGG